MFSLESKTHSGAYQCNPNRAYARKKISSHLFERIQKEGKGGIMGLERLPSQILADI